MYDGYEDESFLVQTFSAIKGGLRSDAPIQVETSSSATKTALRLSQTKCAVIALAITANEKTGDVISMVVLAQYGSIPEVFLDTLKA